MTADGRDLYSTKRPPAHEWIAGIEGQSNFLSLLAGIEAGPDTTQIMGALAFSRSLGATPEVLEAHVAKSVLYKLPLMSMVFMAVVREYGPEEGEWPWIQGAIADAFMLLRDGACKPIKDRARSFTVGEGPYNAMRKVAEGIFNELLSTARAKYNAARRSASDAPGFRHSSYVGETGASFVQGSGCFVTPPRAGADMDRSLTLAISGMVDRLGYDDRQDRPGPVLTLHGPEAEAHCRKFPGQSNRPHSL